MSTFFLAWKGRTVPTLEDRAGNGKFCLISKVHNVYYIQTLS